MIAAISESHIMLTRPELIMLLRLNILLFKFNISCYFELSVVSYGPIYVHWGCDDICLEVTIVLPASTDISSYKLYCLIYLPALWDGTGYLEHTVQLPWSTAALALCCRLAFIIWILFLLTHYVYLVIHWILMTSMFYLSTLWFKELPL